jgi:hypothetical protein
MKKTINFFIVFWSVAQPHLGKPKRQEVEEQRCQMIFFKSARSDVKIRQNPPSRIGQIRQKLG